MKFVYTALLFFSVLWVAVSCEKKTANRWDVEMKEPAPAIQVNDISADYFNPKIALNDFKAKYPWFQGHVPDSTFVRERTDDLQRSIYQEALTKNPKGKISQGLSALFQHIRHYFPEFAVPQVYIFSSGTKMYLDPVMYVPENNFLFIDISGFLGNKNKFYDGIEKYLQLQMNPENLLPQTAEVIARSMIPPPSGTPDFLEKMVQMGKLKTAQQAFLPKTSLAVILNLTPAQLKWNQENEGNIYNFFVENDLLFQTDLKLDERFLTKAPFSKFYTEIDKEASPQVGIFIGKQIVESYLNKTNAPLPELFATPNKEIFNQSQYKPN